MDPAAATIWELENVSSPSIANPISVLVARDVPYITPGNRLQTLSIYIPRTGKNEQLLGKPVASFPEPGRANAAPCWFVYIHGGAWRDPELTSAKVEATVAYAFSDDSTSITHVAAINYRVSPWPTHPKLPYDPSKGDKSDPARDAVHPEHISDVLDGLHLLRRLGLRDDSYILAGHSCGACLAFQAILQEPQRWGLRSHQAPARPAAIIGLNGLYDFPDLVTNVGLGDEHRRLRGEYTKLLTNAFGADQAGWIVPSPARFETAAAHSAPRLVVLDHSAGDELAPHSQTQKMETRLRATLALRVQRTSICKGSHAAPWEDGLMIWENVRECERLLATC